MNESYFEKLLKINTSKFENRMDKIRNYNNYEPTPYEALKELFNYYTTSEDDHFVDFGSGKGRFSFFVNYFFNSGCTSVEIVREFHQIGLKNLESYKNKNQKKAKKIFFINECAEKYEISSFENKFYFFNPFSVNIFATVVSNIIKSVEINNRVVDIILYYPSDEYIDFLERKTSFNHVLDINLKDYYKNPREKFSIYRYGNSLCISNTPIIENIKIDFFIYK